MRSHSDEVVVVVVVILQMWPCMQPYSMFQRCARKMMGGEVSNAQTCVWHTAQQCRSLMQHLVVHGQPAHQ
jgi:hypothetical protein